MVFCCHKTLFCLLFYLQTSASCHSFLHEIKDLWKKKIVYNSWFTRDYLLLLVMKLLKFLLKLLLKLSYVVIKAKLSCYKLFYQIPTLFEAIQLKQIKIT